MKERERAVRRARQQEQARQIRLRRMNEEEMSLQTESPLTVSLNKLSISNAPEKAMVGSAKHGNLACCTRVLDFKIMQSAMDCVSCHSPSERKSPVAAGYGDGVI